MAEGPIFFDPPDMGAWCKMTFESCRKTAKGTGVMFNECLITKDDGTPIASGNLWMSNDDAAKTQYESPVWLMKRWPPGSGKGSGVKPEILATLIDGAVVRSLEDAPAQREGGWGGGGANKPLMTPTAWEAKNMYVFMFLTAEPPNGLGVDPKDIVWDGAKMAADAGMCIDRSVWAMPEEKEEAAAPAPPAAPPEPSLPGVDNVPEVPIDNVGPEEDIPF